MEHLQNLLDASNFQLLTAFLLGLMTAISPCPLATNITAIAFIGKDIENKRRVFINGLIYTLGRALSYTTLGVILYLGASKFQVAGFFTRYGEKILGPMLLVIGILMLDILKIKFPGLDFLTRKLEKGSRAGSSLSALLMGIVFALAFCPYSGVLYFGMLMPITVASPQGLFLPPVFALATGLPVILFAYLIAYTLSGVGSLYNKLKTFEFWFRKVVAVLFIAAGLYYIFVYFIRPHLWVA